MCDVAPEDASVIISELKELGLHHDGSISLSPTDTISDFADAAIAHAPGSPADAVIWEQLDQRTNESVELSGVFLLYMVLAAIIAAIGIFLDSPILVVGRDGGRARVRPGRRPVRRPGPEARPARPPLGHRAADRLPARDRGDRARRRSIFDATDLIPDSFDSGDHGLVESISSPDAFAVHRRRLRGRRRHAQPQHGQVRAR